jgi:hypothetical protein
LLLPGVVALVLVALALHVSTHTVPSARAAGGTVTVVATAAESSLALDSSGNPVVAYSDSSLTVLHCGNPTCTAGNTTFSVGGFLGAAGMSVVIDGAGRPVVSYVESAGLRLLHCGNANCTGGNSMATVDSSLAFGAVTSLLLDAVGNPVISYDVNFPGTDVKVVHCGDASCSAGNVITTVDNGSSSSVALDGAGNPVVAFDASGLRVQHCGDANCTSGNTNQLVDNTVGVFSPPSLALDALGNPVVSYYNATNLDLRLVHCGDPSCSAGNSIVSPDTTGNVGQHPSLKMNGAGNPVVSYYDVTNGDLKLLVCGNPDCNSGNSITAPDTLDHVGDLSSLDLDGSGNPAVSFYDASNNRLRVLRCVDAVCGGIKSTPTPRPRPNFSLRINTDGVGGNDCGTGPAEPTTCVIALGSTFRLKYYLDSLGDLPNYKGFDLLIQYTGIASKGNPNAHDWPECAFPAQDLRSGQIALGCAIGVPPAPPSTYTGQIAHVDFNCTSSGTITMVHGNAKGFTDLVGDPGNVISEGELTTETLNVVCSGATHTATPQFIGGLSFDAGLGGHHGALGHAGLLMALASFIVAAFAMATAVWIRLQRPSR